MSGAEPAFPAVPAGRGVRVLAWGLLALAMLGLPVPLLLNYLLRRAGYPYGEQLDLYAVLSVVVLPAAVSAASVGVVLALRRPRHPVGWILLALGISVATVVWAPQYALYGEVASPGAVPAAASVGQLLGNWLVLPVLVVFILLLTPTGSLPSPRWRWLAVILVAVAGVSLVARPFWTRTLLRGDAFVSLGPEIPNPLYAASAAPPQEVVDAWWGISWGIILLGVWAGIASLAVRFRHARGVERQQLRWAAFAVVLGVVVGAAWAVGPVLDAPALYVAAAVGYVALMPPVIGAAVLRYRLYDLDRIVSRTIAYGLLTVLLGAGYAVVVLGLGQVLGPLLGRGSSASLAVAGATLAVAAAFQPARRRIQDLVDRRFNRRRYDAERIMQEFSERLRQQTDLDELTTDLLAVVDQTMQPTRADLWLRPADDRGGGSGRAPD